MPSEDFKSFKLPRAGTVEAYQRGWSRPNSRVSNNTIGSPTSAFPLENPKHRPVSQCEVEKWTPATEQMQSLFHQATPSKLMGSMQTTNSKCQTEMSLETVRVLQVPEVSFGLITEADVGGNKVKALVDTGATFNLIPSETYVGLAEKPGLRPYYGSLQTANGRHVAVDRWTTMKLKLGPIDDGVEVLVFPELRAEMNIEMRSLKKFQCSLYFQCDNQWTGPQEEAIVPLFYEPLTISPSPTILGEGSRS